MFSHETRLVICFLLSLLIGAGFGSGNLQASQPKRELPPGYAPRYHALETVVQAQEPRLPSGLQSTSGAGLQATTDPASTILPSPTLYPSGTGRVGYLSTVVSEESEAPVVQRGWMLPDGRFIADKRHLRLGSQVQTEHHYPKTHFVIMHPKGRVSGCNQTVTCSYSKAAF